MGQQSPARLLEKHLGWKEHWAISDSVTFAVGDKEGNDDTGIADGDTVFGKSFGKVDVAVGVVVGGIVGGIVGATFGDLVGVAEGG